MFFALSKTLEVLLQPVNFVVLVALFGLLLGLTVFVRVGRAIAAATLLILALFCFSPLSAHLLEPLEDRFP